MKRVVYKYMSQLLFYKMLKNVTTFVVIARVVLATTAILLLTKWSVSKIQSQLMKGELETSGVLSGMSARAK